MYRSQPVTTPRTALAILVFASATCVADDPVPESGQDIADTLPGLEVSQPDIHARLVSGNYDQMPGADKVDILTEIWRRNVVAGGMDPEQALALAKSSLELVRDHPDPASFIERAVKMAVTSHGAEVVQQSNPETPQKTWWYAYSDDKCRNYMYAVLADPFVDACFMCRGTQGRNPPVAVMQVSVPSVGGMGYCIICAQECPMD